MTQLLSRHDLGCQRGWINESGHQLHKPINHFLNFCHNVAAGITEMKSFLAVTLILHTCFEVVSVWSNVKSTFLKVDFLLLLVLLLLIRIDMHNMTVRLALVVVLVVVLIFLIFLLLFVLLLLLLCR